jgi:hypothetical protein
MRIGDVARVLALQQIAPELAARQQGERAAQMLIASGAGLQPKGQLSAKAVTKAKKSSQTDESKADPEETPEEKLARVPSGPLARMFDQTPDPHGRLDVEV